MKICSECGARNADHSYLCNQCGKPLGPAEEQSTGDTDQIPPQSEPTAEDLVTEATDALSDGNPAEAVGLCERALELTPEYVPAFALLGMAHEEMGNLEAALSAYENVVRIDPSRSVERRKINVIKLQMMRSRGEQAESARRSGKWARYGPIILAVGAALLVFVVGAWLIVHNRGVEQQQAAASAYEQAMTLGNEAMADGKYEMAVTHFQAALEARPDDAQARTRMHRARQMAADQTKRAAKLPKYIPSKGPNPFQPVVVPGKDQEETAAADAGPAVPVPDPTTNRPRSVYQRQQGSSRSRSTADTSGGRSDTSTSASDRGVNEGEPISPVPTPSEDQQQPGPGPGEDRASSPEDPGEIRIWASDEPPPGTESSGSTQSAEDPDALRSKADSLRRQGNCQDAAGYYSRAIQGYRQRMENQPALSESARKAIESCQTGRELCETE